MKHLFNNRGESLAEVLVAVLIIAAGLLALAGMVRVASNSVANSKKTVNAFYTDENSIENIEEHSGASASAKIEGSTTSIPITFYSSSDGKVTRYEAQKANE